MCRLRRITIVLLWCLLGCGQNAAAAEAVVEQVTVQIRTASPAELLSPMIEKRMQSSVATIAENLLQGHRVAEVDARRQDYEQLIQSVFARILMGYSVQQVEISGTTELAVTVTVDSWQDVIRQVNVELNIDGTPEELKPLVRHDVQNIRQVVEDILLGLPVDAADWVRAILRGSLNDFLASELPEYRLELDFAADRETDVKLTLFPKGSLIRNVDVSLGSETIPNIALMSYRPEVQRLAERLVGLPVSFVERHRQFFIDALTDKINSDKNIRRFGVTAAADLRIAENTAVSVRADTKLFNITVEGYLDVGRKQDNTSFKLHAGRYISPADEVFSEVEFVPHSMEWELYSGISRRFTPYTTLGLKYHFQERQNVLWARHAVGKKWLLRFEHTPADRFNEFAVRYKLHDYLGVEYVINDDDNWLRLVGNF